LMSSPTWGRPHKLALYTRLPQRRMWGKALKRRSCVICRVHKARQVHCRQSHRSQQQGGNHAEHIHLTLRFYMPIGTRQLLAPQPPQRPGNQRGVEPLVPQATAAPQEEEDRRSQPLAAFTASTSLLRTAHRLRHASSAARTSAGLDSEGR